MGRGRRYSCLLRSRSFRTVPPNSERLVTRAARPYTDSGLIADHGACCGSSVSSPMTPSESPAPAFFLRSRLDPEPDRYGLDPADRVPDLHQAPESTPRAGFYDLPASRREPDSHGPDLTGRDIDDAGGEPDPAHRLRRGSLTQPGARDEREQGHPGATPKSQPHCISAAPGRSSHCRRTAADVDGLRSPIGTLQVLPSPSVAVIPPVPARVGSGTVTV